MAVEAKNQRIYITHGLNMSPHQEAEIQHAVGFAACAHRHQKRKYSGEHYIHHCIAVARLVAESGADISSIIAAVLHDVVEDTEVSFEDVQHHFGENVALLVQEVTKPTTLEDCSREERHKINLAHLKKASPQAAIIKIADIIDNTSTIHERDAKFAMTYINEKWNVLDVLPYTESVMRDRVLTQLNDNLLAAKEKVYPFLLAPYARKDFFVQPSKEYSFDGCILAALNLDGGGAIMVTWRDGRWQHINLGWDKLMQSYVLTEQELTEYGVVMR